MKKFLLFFWIVLSFFTVQSSYAACSGDTFTFEWFDGGSDSNLRLQDESPYGPTGSTGATLVVSGSTYTVSGVTLIAPGTTFTPNMPTGNEFDWTMFQKDYTGEDKPLIVNNSHSQWANYRKPSEYIIHSRINTHRGGLVLHSANKDRLTKLPPTDPLSFLVNKNPDCVAPTTHFDSPSLIADPDTDLYFRIWMYHDVLTNSGHTYYNTAPPVLAHLSNASSFYKSGVYPPVVANFNNYLSYINVRNGGIGLKTEYFTALLSAIIEPSHGTAESTQMGIGLTGLGKVWRNKSWKTASDVNTGLVGQKRFDGDFYFRARGTPHNKISNTKTETNYLTRPVIYFSGTNASGSVFTSGSAGHNVFSGSYEGTTLEKYLPTDTAFVNTLTDISILTDSNGKEASIGSGFVVHSNLDSFSNTIDINPANIRYSIFSGSTIISGGEYLNKPAFETRIGTLGAGEYTIQYDYFATDSKFSSATAGANSSENFSQIAARAYTNSGSAIPQNAIFAEPISRQIIIKPSYKVEYYLQNSDGTSYPTTATESQTLTGTTNASVDAGTRTFTGYTYEGGNTNNIQTGTVLANGSLVLKRYYSINTYTLTFESNGGSSIATQTGIAYNTSASEANTTPTRNGYTFGGWYKDAGLTNQFNFVNDKITQDTTVYAKWTQNPSTPTTGAGGYTPPPPVTPKKPTPPVDSTSTKPENPITPISQKPIILLDISKTPPQQKLPKRLPRTGIGTQESIYRAAGLVGSTQGKVDIRLPHLKTFQLAGTYQTNIDIWKKILPIRDRKARRYMVLPVQGLIVPVGSVGSNTKEYKSFINGGTEDFLSALKNSPITLPGSPKKLEIPGNTTIIGHSSWWKKSSTRYRTHFQKIIAMEQGEEIWIYEKNIDGTYDRYIYRVDKSFETVETNVEVLRHGHVPSITLITCVPIGSNSKRWVVKGKLIGKNNNLF